MKSLPQQRPAMRYDAANRIMSLSFERDAKEHAEVMLAAGRRFMGRRAIRFTWPVLAAVLAVSAAIGLFMELYRRYVLTFFADISTFPTLGALTLQLLPLLILLLVLILMRAQRAEQAALGNLENRLRPRVFVDTDIYPDGIRSVSDMISLQVDWASIRNVTITERRIEFEGEAMVLYLPFRAFESRADYNLRTRELRSLWRKARLKEDGQPVEILA
jgi:hypothetical protein